MSTANKLLRQYYGLDTPDQEQEVRDIDSPHFDPNSFFDEAAKNDSLPQILARENSLVSDIRSFDNDLQTLVYDNYAKFLGASDTVHSLSENISALTTQMDSLQKNLQEISVHSGKIINDLEPNRQRIQRLVGISRLLGRVEFISRLPMQLNACLKTEKYEAAVNVWTKVETILSTQQHFPSFKQIHEDCIKIMDEIQNRIRGQMLNADLSVDGAVTCATLLVKLKNPLGYVCSQLEHHRYLIIDNNLEYEDIPEEPFEALAKLKTLAIDDAETFIKLYKEKLIPLESNDENLSKVNGVLAEFMNSVFDRISKLLPAKILFNLDCNKIASYINLFEKMMEPIATHQQISRHMHTVLQQYTEAKTLTVFDQMKVIISKDEEFESQELFTTITTQFSQLCTHLIDEFQVLVMMSHKECSDFLIHQISTMFEKLFAYFLECDPKKSLVLAMVSLVFSQREILRVFDQLSHLESNSPLQSIQDKLSIDCKQVAKKCLSRYVTSRRLIENQMVIQGMRQFNWTCEDRRQSLKNQTLPEDGDISTPNNATQDVLTFIDDIDDMFNEINLLLSLIKEQSEQGSTLAQSNNPSSQFNSMQRSKSSMKSTSFYSNMNKPTFYGIREEGIHQIDRLFTSVNRLHLSQELGFDVQIILGAIIMYTLKSLLEVVRKNVFSCYGFNQIQVNGYYLYTEFEDKVNQQDLFSALIEEIISSAADRTIDPAPLEVPTLQRIYEEYERKHLAEIHNKKFLHNVDNESNNIE